MIELKDVIARFPKTRVAVIGDLMLDHYVFGSVSRISPEAPVPVLQSEGESFLLGGAGNVCMNLKTLGSEVHTYSIIGNDDSGKKLLSLFKEQGLSTSHIISVDHRCTSKKSRVLSQNHQLIRIDNEMTTEINATESAQLVDMLKQHIDSYEVVVLSDYAKGVLTPLTLKEIIATCKNARVPTIIDPKAKDFTRYKGATLIKPNYKEYNEAAEVMHAKLVSDMITSLDTTYIAITKGKEGIQLFSSEGEIANVKAEPKEVYDVTGAGDTVCAILALALALKINMCDAITLATQAGTYVVGKVGAHSITMNELIYLLDKKSEFKKVVTLQNLKKEIDHIRRNQHSIVFTNGCFDLLHVGHIHILRESKKKGDVLIVGLNSDTSIRRLKGEKRPIIKENERAQILSALEFVDYVVLFEEDTPIDLIELIKPDVLVKGEDYSKDTVVGGSFVESYGGKIELVKFETDQSTSKIVEKTFSK